MVTLLSCMEVYRGLRALQQVLMQPNLATGLNFQHFASLLYLKSCLP